MVSRRRAIRLTMATMGAVLLATAVGLPARPAAAQDLDTAAYGRLAREGSALSRAQADALEASLAANPEDLSARAKLLGFYFRGGPRLIGYPAAIEARAKHILWLIDHHPDAAIFELSETTIDREGHSLADPSGYERAAAAWIEQAQRHGGNVAVLGHAAKFFQLSDKARALALLRQARDVEPGNPQWSAHIGYVSALAVLGVDMINQNGLPTRHNAGEAKGELAIRLVEELKTSRDAAMVGVAGRIIGQYGIMMSAMLRGAFTVDYAPLAETLLARAVELDPGNPGWAQELEQFRKLRAGTPK
jgi:hypothetical protein